MANVIVRHRSVPLVPATCRLALIAALALSLPASPARAAGPAHPVWENSGQAEPIGSALSVAAGDDLVASAGVVCQSSEADCNWFVRVVYERGGSTRWEDRFQSPEFPSSRINGLVANQGRLFAAGWVHATGNYDLLVRSYDLRSGSLLWQRQLDRGVLDFAMKVIARDGKVFVVGYVVPPSPPAAVSSVDFAVFAFDAATGQELWERVTDLGPPSDKAFAVAAEDGSVFVAGPVRSGASLLVQALSAKTGAIRWQDEVVDGYMFNSGGLPGRLVAEDGMLYLGAGVFTPAGDEDSLVRAYDERTGRLRWAAQWDGGGNDEVLGLSVSDHRVFASGFEGADENYLSGNFAVSALDSRTGALKWRGDYQSTPGGDAYAGGVAAGGDVVFACGGSESVAGSGTYAWTVRLYDARSGKVLGMDRAGDDIGDSAANALVAGRGRVVAAGYIGNSFVLRAYRAE